MCDFVGPRDEETIRAGERALGLRFPPTYRRFIGEYGCGNFGSEEIYGIIHQDFEHSGVPDAIWQTLRLRARMAVASHHVVVNKLGNGELACLDLSATGDDPSAEPPVIAGWPGELAEAGRRVEVLAPDFGAFLLDLVRQRIKE